VFPNWYFMMFSYQRCTLSLLLTVIVDNSRTDYLFRMTRSVEAAIHDG
jgi:hypothetical protein